MEGRKEISRVLIPSLLVLVRVRLGVPCNVQGEAHVGRLMGYITFVWKDFRFWSRFGPSDGQVYVVEHEWRMNDGPCRHRLPLWWSRPLKPLESRFNQLNAYWSLQQG
jgi:hypothetical protein